MSLPEVIVFAKQPRAGKVKTRLAASLGEAQALRFYRACLAQIVGRAAPSKSWRTSIAVTPDEAASDPELLELGVAVTPQGGGDLGDRMARRLARARTGAPVIIVGSDTPELNAPHLAEALHALESHDLAIGPSPDGGYWLIGASRPPPPDLFAGVRWSSPHARTDTLANAAGLRVAQVSELEDIDDEAAYRRWLARS